MNNKNNQTSIQREPLEYMEPGASIPFLEQYDFPPYITLAHRFQAPADWSIDSRTMKQYVLQYAVEGAAEYEIEGRIYRTESGDLLVHRPYEKHSIRPDQGCGYVCISIVFHFGGQPFPYEWLLAGFGHHWGKVNGSHIEHLLSEMAAQFRIPGLDSRTRCQGILLQLLSEAAMRLQMQGTGRRAAPHAGRLAQARLYIDSHYAEPLDFTELEKRSGMCKGYLIQQFKKAYGITPGQYLIEVRLGRAKELAVYTGFSIGEIAAEVGYSDVHTFGRVFRQKTGISLSGFRASLQI